MKKQLTLFLIISLLIALNISCKKDKAYIPTEQLIGIKFDINDAEALVIANKSENFRNLYKFTNNDSLVKVNLLTTDNKIITDDKHDFEVKGIYPLNENFILLRGSFYILSDDPSKRFDAKRLLVDIRTGVFYECDLLGTTFLQKNNPINNSIFYTKEGNSIVKIDISEPTAVVKELYISELDNNSFFEFDLMDNMIYGTIHGLGKLSDIKVKTAEGSILNLAENNPNEENIKFWKSPEGHFRIMSKENGSNKVYINKFSYAIGTFIKITLLELDNSNYNYSTLKYASNSSISCGGKTIFLSENYNDNFVYNESVNTFESIVLPEVIDRRIFIESNDYIYTLDGSSLYKIDPFLETYSHIYSSGTFELHHLEQYDNENILISALRNADGKHIFARIDQNNNMTIFKESIDLFASSFVNIRNN